MIPPEYLDFLRYATAGDWYTSLLYGLGVVVVVALFVFVATWTVER